VGPSEEGQSVGITDASSTTRVPDPMGTLAQLPVPLDLWAVGKDTPPESGDMSPVTCPSPYLKSSLGAGASLAPCEVGRAEVTYSPGPEEEPQASAFGPCPWS
jgi:hypothetical protein